MGRWPKPKTPAEATRRWGKSGTVSIDKTRLELDMKVLMTFERKKQGEIRNMDFTSEFLMMAETNPYQREPIGVRFSGHPEALLAMFRALHIEYAKRQNKFKEEAGRPRKRTIILDNEEKEDGNESAPEAQRGTGRNRR